jgi:hypothetical protein
MGHAREVREESVQWMDGTFYTDTAAIYNIRRTPSRSEFF